ncbi:MAG: multidrug efflux SMR transporter [Candidatus Binatia bacterium]
MSWVCLVLAIAFEVSGTTCMKLSQGFARTGPSVLVFVFYGLSIVFLTLAVQRLDISVSYAVWSGLGTAAMAVVGVALFGEAMTAVKALAIALIIAGVVTVNLGW